MYCLVEVEINIHTYIHTYIHTLEVEKWKVTTEQIHIRKLDAHRIHIGYGASN